MADIKLLGNGDLSWNVSQSSGYFELEKFQAVKTGTLKSIRVYFAGGSGNVKVAIYSDSSGSPNALLASATAACSAGWNTINVSDVSITNGAYYWLAHIADCGFLRAVSSGGVAKYKFTSYSTFAFPNPAGTGFTNDTWSYAHAGWGAEGGAGSIIPILAQDRRRRVA